MVEYTENTRRKLSKAIDNFPSLFTAITTVSHQLDLTDEQMDIFLSNTPNGEELWNSFLSRRDSDKTPGDYSFLNFILEVIAEAKSPAGTGC